ncbi:flagellar hook assembly protein FlgD [Rubrivirga litoralis]|uniref:Basal-body rod modification protein FlgD n=1 Tax=Rubrivirga litoralis TaxID=3075598 RepID=A0ABU3BSU7_9BACT|nr:FlgD immunoglobulin-like domain containing protein [Rubrivirga sp. F394]MDT0632367.1 FlgD immunoglobulin-like domain containing protein [Rubrivirga sp. F394]
MTTSPIPSAPPDTGAVFSSAEKSLDRDAFLQLLVTQLSNQDPLNPQEGHEFAAQLAQFTSVEQLTSIGQTLGAQSETLAELAAGLDDAALRQGELADSLTKRGDLTSAASLIGKTVEAQGNRAVWDGQAPATVGVTLERPAAYVRVVVRDAAGQPVRALQLGHLGAGRNTAAWDGLDDAGRPAAPGAYSFTVEATDPAGDPVEATPFTQGRVDRVTIEADGVRFWIGSHGVPMNDLLSLVG